MPVAESVERQGRHFGLRRLSLSQWIVVAMVAGIVGHGDDMKKVGRLALRSIIYFEVITTLALVVGLLMVNLVKPGRGVTLSGASTTAAQQYAQTKMTFSGVIEHTV